MHKASDTVQEKENDGARTNSLEDMKVGAKTNTQTECEKEMMLLLEDSNLEELPENVMKLLSNFNGKRPTATDYLATLIYYVGLEVGFVSETVLKEQQNNPYFWGYSFHNQLVRDLSQFPNEFLSSDESFYKFRLRLFNSPETQCLLICLQTGEGFCITMTPENSTGKSYYLSIPRYVLSIKVKNIAARFRNLKELSFLLKEHIYAPIRNELMHESGGMYPGLTGVPDDIVFIILKYLRIRDVQNLSYTCCKLRNICIENFHIRCNPAVKPLLASLKEPPSFYL